MLLFDRIALTSLVTFGLTWAFAIMFKTAKFPVLVDILILFSLVVNLIIMVIEIYNLIWR